MERKTQREQYLLAVNFSCYNDVLFSCLAPLHELKS